MLKIHCKRLADTIEPTQYHRNHHKHYWYFQPVHHTAYSSVPVLDCFTLGTVRYSAARDSCYTSQKILLLLLTLTVVLCGVVWCACY